MSNVKMRLPLKVIRGPMQRDRQVSFYVSLGDTKHTFEVRVNYMLGGHNWWTYETDPRGIFLGITPMKIAYNDDNSVRMSSYTAFSGTRVLLKELQRYSEKQLLLAADEIFPTEDPSTWSEKVYEVLEHVCEKNEIPLYMEHALFGDS